MTNRYYRIGAKQERQRFQSEIDITLAGYDRDYLPVNWFQLLREPLYLLEVIRLSDTLAIGKVRHFSMGRSFGLVLYGKDIAMLERARGVQLSVGQTWTSDDKFDVEVRQFFAEDSYTGYFVGLNSVQDILHEETTWFTVPQRVWYQHEAWYKRGESRNWIYLVSCERDEELRIKRDAFDFDQHLQIIF